MGDIIAEARRRRGLAPVGSPLPAAPPAPALDLGDGREPFPVDALPRHLRDLATAGAAAIGCDPSFVAVPGLCALAAAIGGSRVAEVNRTWTEPAILWGAVVGESSARKSPAFDLAVSPLWRAQRGHFAEFDAERKRLDADPAGRGVPLPPCRRVVMDDVTLDAVAPVLRDNPRGVLLACEELDSFFQGFTRYTASKATDRPRWLKLYGARPLTVDRKAAGPIYVPAAVASITGTIQPGVFQDAMSPQARSSGLAARWLLTCPPRLPRRWSETTVDESVTTEYRLLVERLLMVPFDRDEAGDPRPGRLPLHPDAKSIFRALVDEFGERSDLTLDADTRALLGKAEGQAARLALVCALAGDPYGPLDVTEIGAEAMAAGAALARWFADEAARVTGAAADPEPTRELRSLVELIRRRGGSLSPNDLRRHNARKYPTGDAAAAALDALARCGAGTWVDTAAGVKGGRPTRRLCLADEPAP